MSEIIYIKGDQRKSVDVDFISSEMAQLLQIDNLSFLIGAGCSSYVESGQETGIPGMTSIFDSFFIDNPDFTISGQDVRAYFDRNLEKMLETLGAILVSNQIKVIEEEAEQKMKLIQNYLREKIIAGLCSSDVQDTYKKFYLKSAQKTRKTPISVFTTNYDLFNEMAMDELGFPYNNGFSGTYRRKFNPASYSYMYVENMNLNRDFWEPISSFYNLVKLHGSISWVRKDEQVWEQDFENIADNDTVMIYPTPLKDRSTLMTPYSDLFRTMENKLMQKNSTLIVMGYSFSDEHINRVILNGLAIPSFRLVVFGKSTNIEKLIELGDTRITIIHSDDEIHYFKNIVEKIMPSIHPDIEEAMQINPSFQGG